MQEEHKDQAPALSELSEIWQELSGNRSVDAHSGITAGEATPPALESDPWSALLQAKGTEVIDLQQLHLPVSDQELEQMLQIMQEQPAQKPGVDGDSASNHQ
ncbi:MAG TPA: hypothetical protein VKV37_20405 [Ktedonobacteraceae bacterium]|nr:hypothetical protein [Ktedonobacteraceae bacterium]